MPAPIIGPVVAAGVRALATKAATRGMSNEARKEAAKEAAKAERDAALAGAKTEVRDGVKETSLPYVDPKKAGDIRDFSSPTSSSRSAPRLSDESLDYAGFKKGGAVKKMAKGGSASSRADGCAVRGKTKGRMI
jgi:hypothetical protein